MSEHAAGGSNPTAPRAADVRSIFVDGRRVRYAVGGSGPPLLLLHGIARSLEDWNDARVDLETRHTVYAIDLAGFGGSYPLAGTSDLPALGRSVLAFLDAVDVREPVRIVGNSLGGAVALQAVALSPERFAALVLVDSAGFGSEVAAGLRALALPGVGRLLLRPNRSLARRHVQGIFHDPAQVTEERIQLAYELASRVGSAEVLLEVGRSLGNLRGIRPEWRRDLLDQVRKLDIPVLLLWGENDRVLPIAHLEAAHEAFPAASTHVFPATGHMPQMERPAEFSEVVIGFLEGVEG